MKTGTTPPGTLYLVPTPLDFGTTPPDPGPATTTSPSQWLPTQTLAVASRLTHWITENAKSTRAFLKRVDTVVGLGAPLQAQQITELPRVAHKKGDHAPQADGEAQARALLAPALSGHDIGLVSEAGMPAVADPGSSVVRAAHDLSIPVVPLVGPVSLLLALAASGLNGQNFAFVGYLPQDAHERTLRIKELETLAHKTGQSQLFIETPYRNAALWQALVQGLQPHTRLALASGLTLPTASVQSRPVQQWRQRTLLPDNRTPVVFALGR